MAAQSNQSTRYSGETAHYSGGNLRNSCGTVNFQPIFFDSGGAIMTCQEFTTSPWGGNIASGSRSRSQFFESPDPLWHVGLSWEDFVGQNLLHPRLDASMSQVGWSKFVARYPSHQWVKSLEVIILPQSIPTCKLQATYLNFNKKNWCIWNFLSGPKPTKRAPGIAPGIVAEPVGVGGSRSLMSEKQSCRTHTGNSKFPWKAKSCRQQWDTMSPRFL